MLRALSSCGHSEPDPRVDELWPSTEEGESRHISVRVSTFEQRLNLAIETIHTNAVLHTCSAFEAALDGLYALALLYQPVVGDPQWNGGNVLHCLHVGNTSNALRQLVDSRVGRDPGRLKGTYSLRLTKLSGLFGIPLAPNAAQLDHYYTIRNTIAHDQSLTQASDPLMSHTQIIQSRVSLTLGDWKTMLASFRETILHLDAEFSKSVVTDGGLVIAVKQTCDAMAPVKVGKAQHHIETAWRLSATYQQVDAVARSLGFKLTTERAVFRRTITK